MALEEKLCLYYGTGLYHLYQCVYKVDATFLRKFIKAYDVTGLSPDERYQLIEYHSNWEQDMIFLRDYRLAELRVTIHVCRLLRFSHVR